VVASTCYAILALVKIEIIFFRLSSEAKRGLVQRPCWTGSEVESGVVAQCESRNSISVEIWTNGSTSYSVGTVYRGNEIYILPVLALLWVVADTLLAPLAAPCSQG
jgi:hypothetical protein